MCDELFVASSFTIEQRPTCRVQRSFRLCLLLMLIRPYKSVTLMAPPVSFESSHSESVNSTGIRAAIVDDYTRTSEASSERSFSNTETPGSLGFGYPLFKSSRSECPVFWRPYCSSEDCTRLVSFLGCGKCVFYVCMWCLICLVIGIRFRLNMLRVFEILWYNLQPTLLLLGVASSSFASYSSLYAPLLPICSKSSHNVTNHSLFLSVPFFFFFVSILIQLTSLALKLAPGHPSRWPDWILSCVSALSNQGVSTEHVHDFLAIVAEEMANADLLGPSKYVVVLLLFFSR